MDGTDILPLKQVDVFAISAPTLEIAKKVISKIQEKLNEPLKHLGCTTHV